MGAGRRTRAGQTNIQGSTAEFTHLNSHLIGFLDPLKLFLLPEATRIPTDFLKLIMPTYAVSILRKQAQPRWGIVQSVSFNLIGSVQCLFRKCFRET